jgi:hypothetical protein
MDKRIPAFVALSVLALSLVWAQAQKTQDAPPDTPDHGTPGSDMQNMAMPGHDMPSANASDMPDMSADGSAHAMRSMESHHMDMGPHMKMTTLRDPKPGDEDRATQVVQAAREAAERYKNYKTALGDGYRIFLPDLPQKQYHFTNYRYAFEAAFVFNPEHPTSLLYEKNGDDYKLIGVMYTAPKRASEEALDRRIPLSIAQWHAHVNLCMPPGDKKKEVFGPHPQFGLGWLNAT